MKKSIFLWVFLSFLLGSTQIFAQFKSGTIVLESGETRSGFIDYSGWAGNPKKVRFKASDSEKATTYTTDDLKRFVSEGATFVKAEVETEESFVQDVVNLDNSSQFKMGSDVVFLREELPGSLGLYYFITAKGKYLFYIKKDDKYNLLLYKRYKVFAPDGEDETIRSNNRYLGQLALYFEGCSESQSLLKNLTYTRKSISKAINGYYKCVGQEVQEGTGYDQPVRWGITLGPTFTSSEFDRIARQFDYLSEADIDTHVGFSGGVYVDFHFQRLKYLYIYTELSYTSFALEADYRQTNPTIIDFTSEFSASYLRHILGVRFALPVGSTSSVFFTAGASQNIKLSEGKNEVVGITDQGNSTTPRPALTPVDYHVAYVLGLGYTMGRFSVEGRFEPGVRISSIPQDNTNRLSLMLFYQINK